MTAPTDLFTIGEAARQVGRPVHVVSRWVTAGKLRARARHKGRILVSLADARLIDMEERAVAERKRPAPPQNAEADAGVREMTAAAPQAPAPQAPAPRSQGRPRQDEPTEAEPTEAELDATVAEQMKNLPDWWDADTRRAARMRLKDLMTGDE